MLFHYHNRNILKDLNINNKRFSKWRIKQDSQARKIPGISRLMFFIAFS